MEPIHILKMSLDFTIGNKGACAGPEKEQDLTVVSYYASMKKHLP